ncbi:MAG: sulfite exporter TauE/SafE family protein [Pirellulales bacterium]|nr:sulfite exporter TauE/SafE family protein [Pirellulales bacterium]
MPHDFFFYFFAALAGLLMGFSKTGIPGVSTPAVAIMAAAFSHNAEASVGAMLPVLLTCDVFAVTYYRRHAQWNWLVGLLPYAVLGMIPGYLVLYFFEGNQLRPILGILIISLFCLELARRKFAWNKIPQRAGFVIVLGILTGFSTMVGNAAGPVMALYLIACGLDKEQFIGTSAWFFFILNLTKVVPFWSQGMLTPEILGTSTWVACVAVCGALLGIYLLPKIPQRIFDRLVIALTGIAGLWLLIPS